MSRTPSPDLSQLRHYVAAGLDIIPLHHWDFVDDRGRERGKSPRDTAWRSREYPAEDVMKWAESGGNVGIRLRETDLVIDYDPRNVEPPGRDVLGELALLYGVDLDACPCVRTGSGGLHFYLRLAPGLRLVNELPELRGIEFKSLGRQVVAAGSVHPNRSTYQWLKLCERPFAPPDLLAAIVKVEAESTEGHAEQISLRQALACLEQLDPAEYRSNDPWFELMQAFHAATGGGTEAREEFVRWSTSDPPYADQADVIRERWASLTADKPGGITVATLYHHVTDAGGTIPNAPAADDFAPLEGPADSPAPKAESPPPPADAAEWSPEFDRLQNGRPKPSKRNIFLALASLELDPQYDELNDKIEIRGNFHQILDEAPNLRSSLSDNLILVVEKICLYRWKLEGTTEQYFKTLRTLGLARPFNPVVEYLESLGWDGIGRLDRWLTRFARAADTPYTRAVGDRILRGAVARAYEPGIEFQMLPILEGVQGCGKSTLVKILGGEWTQQGLPHRNLNDRDVVDAMRGKWIIELEELAATKHSDLESLKAFTTRTTDRARLAYAKASEDYPRRNIIIGTTNEDQYLRDATGNRRFFPIAVGQIDLVGLAASRDQLFAEAVTRWKAEPMAASLVLPKNLWGAAAEEQEKRFEQDPMEEAVRLYLEKIDADKIATRTLAFEVLGETKTGTPEARRIAKIMRRLGWKHSEHIPCGESKRGVNGWRRKP